MRLFFILSPLLLFSLGCSSYVTRKNCEKINWFNHGRDIALRGERLNEDESLKRCQEAEANIDHAQLDLGFKQGMERYCTPEGAQKTGREGLRFNRDLCGDNRAQALLKSYREGLGQFCAPSNGRSFGLSGKIYDGVCPPELEANFKVEYIEGRKRYLAAQARVKDDEVRDVEYELVRAESRENQLIFQLGILEQQHSAQNRRSLKNGGEPIEEPSQLQRTREDLRLAKNQVESLKRQRQNLRGELREIRMELDSL